MEKKNERTTKKMEHFFFYFFFNTSHYLRYSTLHYITVLALLCITLHRVTQATHTTLYNLIMIRVTGGSVAEWLGRRS